jgi:hypothetical protein
MPGQPRRRFCRRCGAEIATANLMDADPDIDRQHFSLVLPSERRLQLSLAEWVLFTALYQRHGRIVPLAELATATRYSQSKLRGLVLRLRRSLVQSQFLPLTHPAHGYELIVRPEEQSKIQPGEGANKKIRDQPHALESTLSKEIELGRICRQTIYLSKPWW